MAAPLAIAAGIATVAATPLALLAGAVLTVGTAAAQPAGGLSDAVPAEYRDDILAAAWTCPEITPDLLAAQIHAESNWNPDAVSPAGAQGIAQFMPGTWATWGGDYDGDGDASAFDPNDAIHAQGLLMCDLVARATASGIPGDPVELALAGYNAGWGAVQAHNGIPPYPETQAYIPKIQQLRATYTAADTIAGGPANSQGSSARMMSYAAEYERLVAAGTTHLPNWADGRSVPVDGWCLRNVQSVWKMLGGTLSPGRRHGSAAELGIQLRGLGLLNPDLTSAPRGALIFWDASVGSGSGHVAVADGRGRMLNNWGSPALTSHPISTRGALGWTTPEIAFEAPLAG